MAHICLAEVAEVMLPHKVGGCLLHAADVQFAMLDDEVLVATLHCIEPESQPRILAGFQGFHDLLFLQLPYTQVGLRMCIRRISFQKHMP